MLIKNILNQIKHDFLAVIALLSLLFVLTSCTDQGCIEADDFGEYESQTVTVLSNASADNCTFDSSHPDVTDPSHGPGIKSCLTSGDVTITDENDVAQKSETGCKGYSDAKFRSLCISNCVQSCLANASGDTSSAEPNWVSTDKKVAGKNIGITIRPGSKIIMRTIGTVVLGDSVTYPDMYVKADQFLPNSGSDSWGNVFFDSRAGQSLMIKFSGQWNDGTNIVGAGSSAIQSSSNDAKIYNGSKRILAQLIPHPDNYDFDLSQTTEQAGAKGVPLFPDPRVWQCVYNGADLTDSTCSNYSPGYSVLYNSNVSDAFSDTAFPFTSQYKSSILTKYGGAIRWSGDNLKNNSYDPFIAVTCNGTDGLCANISSVSTNEGRIIGDLSSGAVEITNNNSDAYKVSFKSLLGNTGCNIILSTVRVTDSSSNAVDDIPPFTNVTISNSSWTSQHITLEPSQKLIISQNTVAYSGGVNCGRVIGIRFAKYHDIKMDTSGFVRFTTLRGSGSCTIKARIVNSEGQHKDANGISADFYEYDHFSTAPSNDPMYNLSVPTSGGNPVSSPVVWSNSVFVRKGQTIRFSPESWDNTWTTSSGLSRQCGIGMVMAIDPRPAALCRGKTSELIDNPNCVPDLNSNGTLLGCKAMAKQCTENNSGAYCPPQCQQAVTCGTPGISPLFAKTGCGPTGNYTKPSGCGDFPSDNSYGSSSCTACRDLMRGAAEQPAKTQLVGNIIDVCYDAENYKGKISNIPANPSSSSDVDTFLGDNLKAKGLTRLGTFNGNYGNLQSFSDTGTKDLDGNEIFQAKFPITFNKTGRLRFLLLDGSDFNGANGVFNSYTNNSASGSGYAGSNGFKIRLSGTFEFSGGEWMQARVCKETSNNDSNPSNVCKSANPAIFTGDGQNGNFGNTVPSLVELTTPPPQSPVGAPAVILGNYKFNSYGSLIRVTAPGVAGDCSESNSGVAILAGSLFYCHTYQYFNAEALKAKNDAEQTAISTEIQKLRITFKILDPEVGSCPLSGQGDKIQLKNPFYDGFTSGVCNTGETPGNGTAESPGACGKEFYCANKYANNSGKYYVNVKVKVPASGAISSIIGSVITPVVEALDGKKDNPNTAENETTIGQAERVYKLLISDPRYKAILTVCLVAMFTFYGFGYLLGVSELNHSEIINRIIKIGLIYLFVGETGWEWFNKIVVKFFKEGTDWLAYMMASSFDNSPELSRALLNNDFYDKSILFSGVDKVFSLFFSGAVQKKISALLFASIFGWAYLIIIYMSFMLYVYAVANSVLLYLTAQVFISILFVLGPIFFIFTLFSQTKEMFDNWLKQLIGFSLQQIFLLTTLAFFNMLMYEVIKMSLGYKICWDEVWTINIITRITLLSFWTIASLPPRTNAQSEVGNIGNPEGIPSLFTILFIWVIASLMKQFIGFMTDLAASIGGGISASSLGSGIADFASKAQGAISNKAGELWKATGAQAVQRLDMALFDSGKMAEEARASREKKNATDLNNKSQLARASEKAVRSYKVDNAAELSKKSRAEQKQILEAVSKKAMLAEGKKLNLDEKEVDRLRSDKGLKYEGTNLIGAALKGIKQAASKGGSLRTAVGDKKISTALSRDESKQALAKMSDDERKEFIAAATSGQVKIQSSQLDKLRKNKTRAAIAVASLGLSEAIMKGKGAVQDEKDWDQAAKELQDEGVITRMRAGTGWARTDAEKKAIRERRKKNKAQQKAQTKSSDADAIADLQNESNYLSDIEEIDPDDKITTKLEKRLDAVKRRMSSKEKEATKKQVLQNIKSATLGRVDSDIKATDEEIGNLQPAHDKAMSDIRKADETLNNSTAFKEMQSVEQRMKDHASKGLKERLRNRKEHSKDVARYEELQKELQKDPSLQEAMQEKREATAAANTISASLRHVEQRRDALADFRENVEQAGNVREQALRAAGRDGTPLTVQQRSANHAKVVSEATATGDKKTEAMMSRAGTVLDRAHRAHSEGVQGSKEYKQAEQTIAAYEKAESKEQFESFVKEYGGTSLQEKRANEIDSAYSKLGNANSYHKFNAKYGSSNTAEPSDSSESKSSDGTV